MSTLPWLSKINQTLVIVNTDDPKVTPKNGVTGWIPIDKADVAEGATKVTVRPLNGREAQAHQWKFYPLLKTAGGLEKDDDGRVKVDANSYDIGGHQNVERDHVKMGTVSVSPLPKNVTLDQFVEWMPQSQCAEISNIIGALTNGETVVPTDEAGFPEDGA